MIGLLWRKTMSILYKSFITKEKIEEFTTDAVAEIKIKDDYFYVKFFADYMGPSPEFYVDDFTFKGINSYSYMDVSKNWRKFMVKTLPDELKQKYIETFNTQLDNEKLSLPELD